MAGTTRISSISNGTERIMKAAGVSTVVEPESVISGAVK